MSLKQAIASGIATGQRAAAPSPRFIGCEVASGETTFINIDRISSVVVKHPKPGGNPEDTEVHLHLEVAGNRVVTKSYTGDAAFAIALALEELTYTPSVFAEE